MALEPRIEVIRKEYGLSQDDFWQIPQNKQWVCKHAALEVVAAKAGITWLEPQIIEARSGDLVTSMIVTGKLGDRVEWSTGETNPTNYSVKGKQPAYPWAMAEKRAKDRVILKLSGIHGLVYSDAEVDVPASHDVSTAISEPVERLSAYRAKTIINFEAILAEIDAPERTVKELQNLNALYLECDAWMPGGWVKRLTERIDQRLNTIGLDRIGAITGTENMNSAYAETMRGDPTAPKPLPVSSELKAQLDKLEADPGYGTDLPPETAAALRNARTP